MNKLFYLFLIYFFLPLLIFGQTSILNDGDWIKIGIIESGIYKIDKNFLDKNKIDIGKLTQIKFKFMVVVIMGVYLNLIQFQII